MKRLQIVVLVADDIAPELAEAIKESVDRALDGILVAYGGELHTGEYNPEERPGTILHTRSYAGPRRKGE